MLLVQSSELQGLEALRTYQFRQMQRSFIPMTLLSQKGKSVSHMFCNALFDKNLLIDFINGAVLIEKSLHSKIAKCSLAREMSQPTLFKEQVLLHSLMCLKDCFAKHLFVLGLGNKNRKHIGFSIQHLLETCGSCTGQDDLVNMQNTLHP